MDEHAFALKSLDDALSIREHVLARFEELVGHSAAPEALDVVICGGGPTGVELAGGMLELFSHVLRKDFRHLHHRRARIVIDRILGAGCRRRAAVRRSEC